MNSLFVREYRRNGVVCQGPCDREGRLVSHMQEDVRDKLYLNHKDALGLDAGCGIGHHTLLLAEAVAPAGHVTGLDLSPEFLIHAKEIAKRKFRHFLSLSLIFTKTEERTWLSAFVLFGWGISC